MQRVKAKQKSLWYEFGCVKARKILNSCPFLSVHTTICLPHQPPAVGSSPLRPHSIDVFPVSCHPYCLSISNSHTKLLFVLVFFPVAVIKYSDKSNFFGEKGFILAHDSKLQSITMGKTGGGGGGLEVHPQLRAERTNACLLPSA